MEYHLIQMVDKFNIKKITFVIAVRKGSLRVKNKNIRTFANSNLLELKIKQIKRVFKNPNIFLSSDCKKSLHIGKKHNLELDSRPPKLARNTTPMKEVYKYLATKVKTKFVCYLHVTSPLLKDSTLKKSLRLFSNNLKNYKCLATVNLVQEYLWYKTKAINYNPNNHPRSQDLKKYYSLNFSINIIDTLYMRNNGRIVANKFFPLILDFPENIDVDDQKQFDVAEVLFKNNFKND